MILETSEMTEKTVKVKVTDRFSVAHDGKRYTKGDTVSAPENVADEWERNRWVERVKS
jgi:hypothetical protein